MILGARKRRLVQTMHKVHDLKLEHSVCMFMTGLVMHSVRCGNQCSTTSAGFFNLIAENKSQQIQNSSI